MSAPINRAELAAERERLLAAYAQTRARTEQLAAGSPLCRGPAAAVDARREPDQVAPRAHHLVLRGVPPRAVAGIDAVDLPLRAAVQARIHQALGARHPRPKRGPLVAAQRRRGGRLSAAGRREADELVVGGRRRDAGPRAPRRRAGNRARRAAPGAAAHRHPARVLRESAPTGVFVRRASHGGRARADPLRRLRRRSPGDRRARHRLRL